MGPAPPPLPEIRPSLAETFDLHANADGFEATIVHLPLAASGLAERIRIDLCLLMCIATGLACTLGGLLVLAIVPVLSPLVLAVGLIAASATDIAREHIEPTSRRVNVMVSRAVQQRSSLRLAASRLHLNEQSWLLLDIDRMEAMGSTVTIHLRDRRPVVLISDHSPWACQRLCVLVNAQLSWVGVEKASIPPALSEIRERVSGRAGCS